MRNVAACSLILPLFFVAGCGSTASRTAEESALIRPSYDRLSDSSRDALRMTFDAAVKTPDDAGLNGSLGMKLLAVGQPAAATPALERALYLQPDSFPWMYYLGHTQAAAGHPAEALETLKKAVAKKPNFLPLQLKIAEVMLAAGKANDAERACRAILAEHPEAASAHETLAALYRRTGDAAQAAAEDSAAEKARAAAPDPSLADPWMQTIMELRPPEMAPRKKADSRQEHFEKGRELLAKKRFKQAIAELMLTLTPEDGETAGYLYSLSIACLKAGDKPNAIVYGTRAKTLAEQQGKTQLLADIEMHLRSLAATPAP